MRIPWPLALLSILLVCGATWFFGTRNYDFITPPDRFDTLPAIASAPTIPALASYQTTRTQGGGLQSPATEAEPGGDLTTFSEPEVRDFQSFPGLDLFVELAKNHPAGRLLQLSSLLQAEGETVRATLALERVLEHPEATPDQRAQATASLYALSSSSPPWAIDPTSAFPLNLQMTATGARAADLREAAKAVTRRINDASQGVLKLTTQISVRQIKATPGATVRPSLTFQMVGDKGSSALSILRLPLPDGVTLEDELASALTKTVLESPAAREIGLAIEGQDETDLDIVPRDLEERTTRYLWQRFAENLAHPPTSPASGPAEPDEEI